MAYVVDVTTEIPYSAPVVSSPTHENVPLKSIEFFLRFRIIDAIRFVRIIGAGNFDLVLSNSVQDAIRQRSRQVRTERAYDLRGSDVKDMQDLLNQKLAPYGVQIMGCNIPDVQLPDQVIVHTDGGTDTSALSMLLMAQLLPQLGAGPVTNGHRPAGPAPRSVEQPQEAVKAAGEVAQALSHVAEAAQAWPRSR